METIDLYDKNKNKLNKTFIRKKDTLLENEYYLLEQAWIVNDEGKILLTQRGLNKSHGEMWEATAGHVKAGETDMEGILREIKEEIGITLKNSDLNFIKSLIIKQGILDIWLVRKNINLSNIKLRESETIDVKYVSFEEFKKMYNNKEIVQNLDYFFDIYKQYINK
ncbi:MAG: NUDIX domain-containing protein [Bacilli bacterium]